MRKVLYVTIIAVITAVLAGSLWLFMRPTKQTDTGPLRVGILKHESTLPIYIADEFKFFEKHGVRVQLVELPPGDHMPALLADRVNIISPTSFPTLFGVMSQHPNLLYAVFPGAEISDGQTVYGFIVKSDSQAKSVQDLGGSVIMAINPYTKVNVQTILSSAGLRKESWPEIRVASREAALQAVATGTATTAIMDQPALAVALSSPDFRLLEANPRAKYIGSPYWSGSGAVKKTVWDARKSDFEHLMAAVDEAVNTIRNDSLSAHRILAVRLGLNQEIADEIGGYYFPLSHESVPREGIQKTSDALRAAGLLESSLSLKEFFPPKLYGNSR